MNFMMDFLQNNNDILRCFVEMLWQEQKPVVVGQLIWSPSLPNGVIAKVTQAGTLGADEPIWPSIVGSTVESGSAVLKIVLWAPETLPADGGTAALANNAEKLGGQLPAYYATATQLAAKAALLSPAFAGIPTAPTADAGTNTDQIATTKFVMTALSALSSQGKIVSYSLAQNGYCKWDIGLILQWGKILGDTVNLKIINFPVSFNECFGGLALFNGDPVAAAEYATITDITNTNFKIYMYANNAGTGYANANIFYLFLGAQQQWGFTVFDPVYYKNVNFTLPLSVNGTFCAFSTGYDAKVSTFLWHSMSHFNNVNVGVTGFVFDSRYTFTGLGYLAICWQKQWGIKTEPYGRVTFPISFQACFGVITHFNSDPTNYAETSSVTNFSNTDFYVVFYFNNSGSNAAGSQVFWVAIGNS